MGHRWPDAPSSGTPAKTTHVVTLRNYIDADLSAIGHSYPWTWDNLSNASAPHPAPILAKYFTEMRAAIQDLWNSKSRGPLPDWASGTTPGGPSNSRQPTIIKATDIADLRLWLNMYEDNHAHSQGIDTLSYDVTAAGEPITHDAWTNDIFALKTEEPLYTRCLVRSPVSSTGTGNLSPTDLARFASVFKRYRAKGFEVFPIYTNEFYANDSETPSDPFDADQFSNPFIRAFAQKLKSFYNYLENNTGGSSIEPVRNLIIWNEPNVANAGQLPASHFAALLYACYSVLPTTASIYWGGVKFGPGDGVNPDGNTLAYIRAVHQELKDRQLSGGEFGPWPWAGINVHIHGEQASNAQFPKIKEELDSIRKVEFPGSGYLFVGEWGVQHGTYQNDPDRLNTLYGLIRGIDPDAMFFYSHHDHQDPVNPGTASRWGIRTFEFVDSPPGTPYPDNTTWFAPGNFAGPAVGTPPKFLWEKYDLLMGQ